MEFYYIQIGLLYVLTIHISKSGALHEIGNSEYGLSPIARGALSLVNDIVLPGVPSSWSSLATTEPGFDLTEEEMIKFKIWPQGIIPYLIDDYSFDNTLINRIRKILDGMSSLTGVKFTELSRPPDIADSRWVLFINRRGLLPCQDYTTKNFTIKGVQRVVLGYDCVRADGAGLAPMILALVGVSPQHNAPNRDKHIDVHIENVIPEKRDLFKKLEDADWLFEHVNYDFLSAGHYDFHKYSLNGAATIVPKLKLNYSVGEEDGISITDIWKVRMLYNYIILKKPKANVSDCKKIFKPGPKPYESDSEDSLLPRKKPQTYLGVADAEPDAHTDTSAEKNNNEKRPLSIVDYSRPDNKLDEGITGRPDRSDTIKLRKQRYSKLKKIIEEMPDFNTSDD